MMRHIPLIALLAWSLAACNISRPNPIATPTARASLAATSDPHHTAAPTQITIMPAPTETAQTATSAVTDTAPPPTPTPTSTETPGPFEYVIQEGDTLYYIIQLPQHGYGYDEAAARAVVALNDNMSSIDILPPAGSAILIPRPTMTSTPIGAQATQALLEAIGIDDSSGVLLAAGAVVSCHEVESGDSLVGIAVESDTTLEVLSQLNPDLNWFGCAFTERSGGPDCNPTIQIGQCIRVPRPAPLPSPTPTPSGDETATPLPTYLAPRTLYPADGDVVSPGALTLQWIGLSGLDAADEYLIELRDLTDGREMQQITQANVLTVSDEFVPKDGQMHSMLWRVSAARPNDDGAYSYQGQPGIWRSFEWMSR